MELETADTIPAPPDEPDEPVSWEQKLDRLLCILSDELPRLTAYQHASSQELRELREAVIDLRRNQQLIARSVDLIVGQSRAFGERLTAIAVKLDRMEDDHAP